MESPAIATEPVIADLDGLRPRRTDVPFSCTLTGRSPDRSDDGATLAIT